MKMQMFQDANCAKGFDAQVGAQICQGAKQMPGLECAVGKDGIINMAMATAKKPIQGTKCADFKTEMENMNKAGKQCAESKDDKKDGKDGDDKKGGEMDQAQMMQMMAKLYVKASEPVCGCSPDGKKCGFGGKFALFMDKDCSQGLGEKGAPVAQGLCKLAEKNCMGSDGANVILGDQIPNAKKEEVAKMCKGDALKSKLEENEKKFLKKCVKLMDMMNDGGNGGDGGNDKKKGGDKDAQRKEDGSSASGLFGFAAFALAALALY